MDNLDHMLIEALDAHRGSSTLFCVSCPEWRPTGDRETFDAQEREHSLTGLREVVRYSEAVAWREGFGKGEQDSQKTYPSDPEKINPYGPTRL